MRPQTLLARVRSWPRLQSWMRGMVHRSSMEREMDEELRFHIDAYADDLVRQGLSREEALRRARVEFGGIEARKEDCRDARGLRLADEVRGDVRYAMRQLRRAPMFTAIAVLSLGLGIGANTAIFSMMEQALWKSMAVRSPERLRLFTWVSGPNRIMHSDWGNWSRPMESPDGAVSEAFSYDAFQALQQRASAFEEIFAFKSIGRVTAVIDGHADVLSAQLVSGNAYRALAVIPSRGRAIEPSDDQLDRGDIAAVISDGLWSRRFGRDPSVVGRAIRINQQPVTIVGINPPGFTGVTSNGDPDIFLPLTTQPRVLPWQYGTSPSLLQNPDYWWIGVMGRLRADVPEQQAQAEGNAILQQVALALRDTFPDRKNASLPRLQLLTGARGLDNLREDYARPLLMLFALVIVVLLTACANVANLLLARAAVRYRELSLRLSLGASRGRIARQLLTEGLTLGIAGGLLGVAIGYWCRDAIPSLIVPAWQPDRLNAAFNTRVLLLSIIVTVLTSVMFSLAPIWQSMRVEIGTALKDGGRSVVRGASPLRGRALLVFQVSLSVLLLIAAGLFVRTLANLRSVDLGFAPERVQLFTMDPPRTAYKGRARTAMFDRIREELSLIPGVEDVTLVSQPLVGASRSRTSLMLEGDTGNNAHSSWVNDVGHRFTETMGIPIVAGRSFDAQDRADSPAVAIVNQRWVRELYPDTPNAIGRTFRNNNREYRIIGICGDTTYDRARQATPPTFYRLFVQNTDIGSMTFALRTSASTASIMQRVRQAVDHVDKDLPVFDVRTQVQQIDSTMSEERLFATLTVALGALALLLASIGIYGLMANNVSRRTSEIGIRVALGAHRRDVLLMILREAAWLAVAGVAIGVVGAAWLGRYVEAMLFGVRPADPLTFTTAIAIMLLVATLASWLPARRAARLDPMTALRHD